MPDRDELNELGQKNFFYIYIFPQKVGTLNESYEFAG